MLELPIEKDLKLSLLKATLNARKNDRSSIIRKEGSTWDHYSTFKKHDREKGLKYLLELRQGIQRLKEALEKWPNDELFNSLRLPEFSWEWGIDEYFDYDLGINPNDVS